jgi:hypothetical protein
MRKDQPSLPTNRAFVVQLHADAQPEQGNFKGRVEHIVSMKAEHFNSVADLVAFLTRTLVTQQLAEAVSVQETEG